MCISRVKIYYAAHTILVCTVFFDMARHNAKSRAEIAGRTNKQVFVIYRCVDRAGSHMSPYRREYLQRLEPGRRNTTPQPPKRNFLRRSAPIPTTQPITSDDKIKFDLNPATLIGKQFILDEESEGLLFQVNEARMSMDGTTYQVQFEDCIDCVDVLAAEMTEMLARSSAVEG